MLTNQEIIQKLIHGTTYQSQKKKPKVLANDGKLALVKHPGGYVRGYIPPWVDVVDLRKLKEEGRWGGSCCKSVWDYGKDSDGPLTTKRLVSLCEKLGISPVAIVIDSKP